MPIKWFNGGGEVRSTAIMRRPLTSEGNPRRLFISHTNVDCNTELRTMNCWRLWDKIKNQEAAKNNEWETTTSLLICSPLLLTLYLLRVTKTEFFLTISIQNQAHKWWEWGKISIRGLSFDHLSFDQLQILITKIKGNVWKTVWRITL